MLLTTLCAVATLGVQDPGARLAEAVARSGGLARTATIGHSLGGRPIQVVTLAAPGPTPPSARPGVLILAGLHGQHRLGTELAVHHVERLVDAHAAGDETARARLADHVFHVIPTANPDGAALGRSGNARAVDVDRDGASDEDAPRDVDGDGHITWMRWPDPDGDHVLVDGEPRLMRKADPKAGERGTHHLAVEGVDADGDGKRAEDDADGVRVHRNFSHRHDEFGRITGRWPMSEPETRAIADFVFANRNLVMAFVWDVDDNLLAKPAVGKPKARTQLDGILEDDLPLYETVGSLYREVTGRTGRVRDRHDGSAWSWLHFQGGIPAFASDVWRAPEGTAKTVDAVEDARARLAHCDAVGHGFVAWRAFEHPELGAVEVGGFVQAPDTALVPADALPTLLDTHHQFVLRAIDRRPEVRIRELERESLGSGAWRITATIVNDGALPALSATGARSRRFGNPRWELRLGDGVALAVGEIRGRTGNLEARVGRETLEWIVTGPAGATVTLDVAADPVGGSSLEVTL